MKDILATGVLLMGILLGLFNILIKPYFERHTITEKNCTLTVSSKFFEFKKKELKEINTSKETTARIDFNISEELKRRCNKAAV